MPACLFSTRLVRRAEHPRTLTGSPIPRTLPVRSCRQAYLVRVSAVILAYATAPLQQIRQVSDLKCAC